MTAVNPQTLSPLSRSQVCAGWRAVLGLMLLCGSIASSDVFAATYYRWVDDQGTTHFTSTPPKGRPAEKVSSRTAASAPVEPAAVQTQTEQPQAAKPTEPQPMASAKDEERCAIARQRVQTLQSGRRIRVDTEDGGYRFLTPEDIAEELAQSEQAISESC